ncbi:MAG TPA: hypothetical protein VGP93_07245 [Polyangiaceae bacterium]|nr:hypothetical protein [Polyangiaceae bacterium]
MTSGAPRSFRDPAFERAFVAVRYFLGARGTDLAEALDQPSTTAQALASELNDPDRQMRAQVLASELGHVVRALEARSYR